MFGCTVCPRGQNACPRCSTPLCDEHVPFRREACAECELAYHEERDGLGLNRWFLGGFALPWAGLAAISDTLPEWSMRAGGFRAITTGVPMLDILIMTAVVGVFAGKAAIGIRSWLHRRSFMGSRTPPVAKAAMR
jgi:hypothetical protein